MRTFLLSAVVGFLTLTLSCRTSSHNEIIQGSDTSKVNTLKRQASQLLLKEPDSAISLLNNALAKSESLQYINGMADAYEYLGIAYFYKYLYDTALYLHDLAYHLYEKAGNKKGMALVLYSQSYDYSLLHNLNKSLELAEKSRFLYEECQDFIKVYDCIEALVYIHKRLYNYREVDSLMKELVSAAQKTNDRKKIANSYYNLGSHYIERNYLHLAIEAFYKALRIAESSGDSVEIANALGSIGLAYLYLRDYQNAIRYYKNQEKILLKLHNEYEMSITYTNLGEIYNGLKDHHAALYYHRKALKLRETMNFQLAISSALHNTAYTYFLLNDSLDQALNFTRQSMKIDAATNNRDGFARNYMLLGKIFVRKKNIPEGINYLEKSISLAEAGNNSEVTLESAEELSKLYAQTGNFKKAYVYNLLFNQLSDSLTSGENVKRITQLEMQHTFDREKSEADLKFMSEKLQLETRLKRNKLVSLFSLILGFMLIVFGTFIYDSYRKSKKAEMEKAALLKEIHHRVKNNLMVISSLLNLQSGTLTDQSTKAAIRESQSRVKSMALIHQLLYQTELLSDIDFSIYLEQLMASLQSAYHSPGKKITYSIQADDIRIDIDTAIPLGLITNELATNAYKYAFDKQAEGCIRIDFQRLDDHYCRLRISDNGDGLPAGFDPENSTSLGLKLVKILSKQIKARLEYSSGNGTEFRILFPDHMN